MVNGNGATSRSNAMVVRRNGNVEVENRVIGAGTAISKQQARTAAVGNNGTAFKTLTVTFPVSFSSAPRIVATAKNAGGSNYDDTFMVAVRTVSATAVTFNIVRVDLNAGWGQNLLLDWMAW